tara:strand:- start:1063 stop:1224 length:162 start_codon:yes stop_codon:yes gene_type:complete
MSLEELVALIGWLLPDNGSSACAFSIACLEVVSLKKFLSDNLPFAPRMVNPSK